MAYISKTGFQLASRRVVTAGQLIASDDPDAKFMLKQGLIVDIDEHLVEQATAAPGVLRAVSVPKKKKKQAAK